MIVENRPGVSSTIGTEPVARSAPEQFTGYIKTEFARWANVIREAGITAERVLRGPAATGNTHRIGNLCVCNPNGECHHWPDKFLVRADKVIERTGLAD